MAALMSRFALHVFHGFVYISSLYRFPVIFIHRSACVNMHRFQYTYSVHVYAVITHINL